MFIRKNKTIVEYPKVSIITCVYNGEKYISKLLDSVLNMGYPNIEHIIVNDGSTDSTEDIVMEYAELYKKKEDSNLYIKYIKQDNMGLGGATNNGLKQITGEYWTWINCDDWYEEGAFFEPVELMIKKPKLDYIQLNGYYHCEGKNKSIFKNTNRHKYKNKKKVFIEYAEMENFVFSLYVCRSSSYKRINHSMQIYPSRYTQDNQLICQIFGLLNGDIVFDPKWFFLKHNDSYLYKVKKQLKNNFYLAAFESINMLSVRNRYKDTLKNVLAEATLLKKYKVLCLNHDTKKARVLLFKIIKLRKHIGFLYRIHLDKKIFVYYAYSLLKAKKKRN